MASRAISAQLWRRQASKALVFGSSAIRSESSGRVLASSIGRLSIRSLSTTPPANESSSSYSVVDHSDAYEAAMAGRHGQQLALAQIDAVGKDDDPMDQLKMLEALEAQLHGELFDPNNEEEAADEIEEAEFQEKQDDDDENQDDNNTDEITTGVDDDDDEIQLYYNNDGSIMFQKSQLAMFRAGAPAGGLFAVIPLAGSQHKVTIDDVVVVNKLKPVHEYAVGTVHTLKDILLVGSSHKTLVGMPIVQGAEVDVMIEEITRDEKLVVFKKRRRKNSQRRNGFRRDVTMLRILDIRMPESQHDHKYIPRVEAEIDTASYAN